MSLTIRTPDFSYPLNCSCAKSSSIASSVLEQAKANRHWEKRAHFTVIAAVIAGIASAAFIGLPSLALFCAGVSTLQGMTLFYQDRRDKQRAFFSLHKDFHHLHEHLQEAKNALEKLQSSSDPKHDILYPARALLGEIGKAAEKSNSLTPSTPATPDRRVTAKIHRFEETFSECLETERTLQQAFNTLSLSHADAEKKVALLTQERELLIQKSEELYAAYQLVSEEFQEQTAKDAQKVAEWESTYPELHTLFGEDIIEGAKNLKKENAQLQRRVNILTHLVRSFKETSLPVSLGSDHLSAEELSSLPPPDFANEDKENAPQPHLARIGRSMSLTQGKVPQEKPAFGVRQNLR